MATQVDIINSERVAQRVVRNLKLADNPQVRAQWLEATEGEGTIEQWLTGCLRQGAGRAALAREQRHRHQLQGAGPALRRRHGQRLHAGLHGDRARAAREPGAPVLGLLRREGQGAARHARACAGQAQRLPEGQRHHRHRRAAGRRERAPERALVAAGGAAGAGRRVRQPPAAGQCRRRRAHAGGAEQPADRRPEGRREPRRGAPAGAERAPRRRPPAGGGGQGQHRIAARAHRDRDPARDRQRGPHQHRQPAARWPTCAPRWPPSAPRCCA